MPVGIYAVIPVVVNVFVKVVFQSPLVRQTAFSGTVSVYVPASIVGGSMICICLACPLTFFRVMSKASDAPLVRVMAGASSMALGYASSLKFNVMWESDSISFRPDGSVDTTVKAEVGFSFRLTSVVENSEACQE